VLAVDANHAEARDGRARAERGRHVDELLTRADNFAKAGQAGEAAAVYRQVLQLEPQNAVALAALAEKSPSDNSSGDPKKPDSDAETARRDARVRALIRQAESARGEREYDAAIQFYEQAIDLDPDAERAQTGLRDVREAKRRADEALARLSGSAGGTQPGRASVDQLLNRGIKAMDSGDDAAAQRAFEEVLRLDPKNERARTLLRTITGGR
jgi:tetratricopeptide (TPR) repeat protein